MGKVWLVLAAALLIGVAACADDGGGGGDGNEVGALSESEFRDQADAVCQMWTGQNPVDFPTLIREIDQLVPPQSMQDDVSLMLTQFRAYQDALDAGEAPSARTVRRANRLADELGLPSCAEVLDA